MNRTILLGVYRVFRKMGVKRDEISLDAQLKENLFFDDQDWNCLMFFIESNFLISLSISDEKQLKRIDDVVRVVSNKLNTVCELSVA